MSPTHLSLDYLLIFTSYFLILGMPAETATAIVSLLMGGILEQFPKLRICFAHGGGSFPYTGQVHLFSFCRTVVQSL